jgi:outer membrane protein OmpA-like peptidoglycan-associated protein/tetratricopeptide (TPR) repeat protein
MEFQAILPEKKCYINNITNSGMKTIRVLLILLNMFAFLQLSQAQLNTANKLYQLCRYSEAIPLYSKAAEKEPDPKRKAEAITRLADCYRLTNNTEMAAECYAKVIQLENVAPVNYLYYGQALQSKGFYLKAKAAFLRYNDLAPADPRGSLLAASCDLPEKWENSPREFDIRNMTSVNSKWSDFGPAYYRNGLIFTSDRKEDYLDNNASGWTSNDYFGMYFVIPDNPGDPFSNMREVNSFSKNFNQPYHDGPAAFSTDFSTIYLTRSYNDRSGKKNHIKNHLLKIFYAKTNGKSWSGEKPFSLNSKDYSVADPSLSADGKTIYFSSDMPGGFGASDIWCSVWKNEKWSTPENLGKEVNTFGNEVFPFILNDSTLYFASNGLPGYGGLDVFVTKKKNGLWQTPRNIQKPVNSSYDDFSFILDAGGDHGFFSSNRPDGLGSDDIYAIKRLRVIPDAKPVVIAKPLSFFVSGYVRDKNSLLPVAGATVYLLNTKTGRVKIVRANAKGFYKSAVDKGGSYLAKAIQLNFLPDCLSFPPVTSSTSTLQKAPHDLLLDKLELNKVYRLANIYYEPDKWEVPDAATPELDKLVKIMMENPISVELGSHTDSHGTFLDNDILSQKRAEAVVKYIIQKGIGRERITAKGYGERKLINHCADGVICSPEEDAVNRRTEFRITAVSATMPQKYSKKANYKEGDEIDRGLLSPDFFDNCLNTE